MSSVLLMDEPVIVLQPALVRALGNIHDAAILQQLHYWSARAESRHDGEIWVYKTYVDWSEEIGITEKQTKSALQRLELEGIVISCQPEGFHRRKWYRISYDHDLFTDYPSAHTVQSNEPIGPLHEPNRAIPSAHMVPCNTKNTTETTTEITKYNAETESAIMLSELLADLIADNGSKRPKVSAAWVKSIERMMRIDGRTESQIENAIRWAQADDFWSANILSPDKLRKHYDRMRLQAARKQTGKPMAGVSDYLQSLLDD